MFKKDICINKTINLISTSSYSEIEKFVVNTPVPVDPRADDNVLIILIPQLLCVAEGLGSVKESAVSQLFILSDIVPFIFKDLPIVLDTYIPGINIDTY